MDDTSSVEVQKVTAVVAVILWNWTLQEMSPH
jgi:hypothetical protein